MKRKLITAFILFIMFGSVATAGIWYYSKAEARLKAATVAALPDFTFIRKDGSLMTPANIDSKKSFILVFISTSCPHCQKEAAALKENISKFSNTPIYMVATEDQASLDAFGEKFGVAELEGLELLRSDRKTFGETFSVTSIPTILIYNKNKKLIQRIEGYTEINDILSHVPNV